MIEEKLTNALQLVPVILTVNIFNMIFRITLKTSSTFSSLECTTKQTKDISQISSSSKKKEPVIPVVHYPSHISRHENVSARQGVRLLTSALIHTSQNHTADLKPTNINNKSLQVFLLQENDKRLISSFNESLKI